MTIDPTTTPPSAAQPTETIVLDLPPEPVDRRARLAQLAAMTMIIFGVCVCVLIPLLLFASSQISRWFGRSVASDAIQVATIIALVLLAMAVLNFVRRRAIARWLQIRSEVSLQQLASEFSLRRLNWFFNPGDVSALATCLALRFPGRTVLRLMDAADLRPVAPLTVPIEPMLINGRDANFDQLADDPDQPPNPGRSSAPGPKFWRSPIFYSPLGFFIEAIVMFFAISLVTSSAVPGWLSWAALLVAPGLVAFLVLSARRPQTRGEFWFIVNGAIVVRRRGRLAIFPRSECSLIVDYPAPTAGRLIVSNGTHTRSYPITAREAAATLRAWLSPLSPPDLAKLSDLQ